MSSRTLSLPLPAPETLPPVAPVLDAAHDLKSFKVATIEAVNRIEWDALVPRDEPHLRADFLAAVEKSGMAKKAEYLMVRGAQGLRDDALLGVAVVYHTEIDLLSLASPKLKNLAHLVRRGPLKRFLIARALSCGPVINNCRSNFFIAPEADEKLAQRVMEKLVERVNRLRGGALRLFFELDDAQNARYADALKGGGFLRGASLPGTRLPIAWESFEDYQGAMRKFYRRAVVADLRVAQQLDIRIESDFSHLADEACALYRNVVERAQTVIETLTPEFFAEIGKLEAARLVTAREKSSGRLVGVELLLLGENSLQDLYTGVDYSLNETHRLYFNLSYPGIEMACRENLRCISMGQTSYAFKSRLGVQSYPLHIYVKHRNAAVQWLLKHGHKLIFPEVEVPVHRVFRSGEEAEENYQRSKK